MRRSSLGRVGVAAAAMSIGVVSPLVANAATPTKPTAGNLSISINGELKHQEGSATATTVGTNSWALAVGEGAQAIVKTDTSRAEAIGDETTVVLDGAGNAARATGEQATVIINGNDNALSSNGDYSYLTVTGNGNSAGIDSQGFHMTLTGNSNIVSVTGYNLRQFVWTFNDRRICWGPGCTSSSSAAMRDRADFPVTLVGSDQRIRLFGNGVDAALDCTGDACNGGRGGLIWGNGGAGANGGSGGSAGLFGTGGAGADATATTAAGDGGLGGSIAGRGGNGGKANAEFTTAGNGGDAGAFGNGGRGGA
ncbi:hypothetical protein WN67_24075, partial [Mycolicibacterium obuense]